MKIKNVLLSVTSLALVAAVAIGGTLAYLKDSDSDVNVMTTGNVYIQQNEYERAEGVGHTNTKGVGAAEGDLVVFDQNKITYPAVASGKSAFQPEMSDLFYWGVYAPGGNGLWDDAELANVRDKIVMVTNTGDTDAYFRTIVAFECPKDFSGDLIHINANTSWYNANTIGYTDINDVRYFLIEYTYKGNTGSGVGILSAGETARPSLLQVCIDGAATNEDCAMLGDTWEVLVVSQAVQAAGFNDAQSALDEAFGKVADNAADWFTSIPRGFQVSNDAELKAAIEAGETEIYLNAGTYHMPSAAKGKILTFNGTKDSVIEVVPAGQGEANGQLDYSFDGSTVTFNGITIKTNSQLYAGYARLSGTYNNCVIQNTYNLGTGNSEFNNCVFNITNEYLRVGGAYSAAFNGCTFNTDGRAILVFQDGTSVAQTVTVKDCTFNATAAANTWNGIHVAAVSIDGTNGTYVVNLEGTNTVDSDMNGLWQIKAGEANVTVNDNTDK